MRGFRSAPACSLAILVWIPATALAQGIAPEVQPPRAPAPGAEPAPAEPPRAPPSPASSAPEQAPPPTGPTAPPGQPPAPSVEPAPAPPVAPAGPAPFAPPPVPPPPAPAPSLDPRQASEAEPDDRGHGESWYESLDISAFVDGYYSLNFNGGKPQVNRNGLRSFDRNNGFSLSWAALDVAYSSETVGATVSLRLGPSSAVYAGEDTKYGLQYVKEAYATWRPLGADSHLTLDFGKFESIYGSEVADSQANTNYTRGALYTLAQPYFFTGLRAAYTFSDAVSASLFAANGWNNSVDNNAGKSFGAQISYSVPRSGSTDKLLVAKLGYVMGPEQLDYYSACPSGTGFDPSTSRCVGPGLDVPPTVLVDRGKANTEGLRHLIDLVVRLEPTDALTLVLDGTYGHDTRLKQSALGSAQAGVDWYGASLTGRYQFSDVWALGLRGEYLGDPQAFLCDTACSNRNVTKLSLYTGTLTIEADPAEHLIIKLDGRLDKASEPVFTVVRDAKSTQVTATLGVVATTN